MFWKLLTQFRIELMEFAVATVDCDRVIFITLSCDRDYIHL